MTVFLAGMRATADRMNDHTLEDSTSSGVIAASGWTIVSFSGRKVNGVTTVNLAIQRSGASIPETSAGSGNIADTDCATLPAGWRPPEFVNAWWGTSSNDGRAAIDTGGVISVRTTSGSAGIASGDTIRVDGVWISAND
ncbi:hypothetical protein [Streptomyces sp. NPDC006997]|uniref:hypothetical protein n=1 Tax=Streptomyces sp. NPDC006997 TaxID=3155356 RepID=UPI00340F2437